MPYSYEPVFEESNGDETKEKVVDHYSILDPQGDHVANVYTDGDAEALISHLNR